MHSLKVLLVALVLCVVALALPDSGRAVVDGTVVEIDENAYSAEDMRNWWLNWRDKGMEVPATPDPYIDWLLFVREAERMALFDDAQFQYDAGVYLKVISLVNLKHEEIDSKIDYSDENLWTYYQENFSPEWVLNILIFKDEESAKQKLADLQAGKVTVADLAKIAGERAKQEQANNPHGDRTIDVAELKKMSGAEEKLLGVHEKVGKRPNTTEKGWREIISGMKQGSYSQPFSWQESFVVLNLLEVKAGDRDDFEKKKGEVRNRYRKHREGILTYELIEQLKKKFQVRIDEERLAKIDPSLPLEQYADTPVITLTAMTISEKELMDKVLKDRAMNQEYGFKAEESAKAIRRVADGIVSQTLTTLESLDRHYERTSPTKEVFDFYKHNKLVKRLEQQIRTQGKAITDQEKENFYKEHLADFTSPQVYRMAVIEGAEEELKKIWLEVVVNGQDVMVVTEERLGHRPQVASYPANHLAPEIKTRAAVLAKGDLSQVFPSGKGFAMLYMAESIPSRTAKYEDIKEMIGKKMLRDRFASERDSYIKALKEGAKIEINDTVWNKLREELVKENEKK